MTARTDNGEMRGSLRLHLAQRARQTPLRMTASLFDRGRWTRFARPTLATMKPREDGAPGCIIEMPVAKATIQSGCIQGPEGPCSLPERQEQGQRKKQIPFGNDKQRGILQGWSFATKNDTPPSTPASIERSPGTPACRAMKLRVEDGAPGNGEMRRILHCAALRSG